MLAPEVGGIRPWELEAFTPAEERALYARAREIENARREVS